MADIGFIVLAAGAEPAEHQTVLSTPAYNLMVIAVPDYATAANVAQNLYATGVKIIELCGGFGHIGAAEVARAVPEAQVGVVRFDNHPGLSNESGDAHFGGR